MNTARYIASRETKPADIFFEDIETAAKRLQRVLVGFVLLMLLTGWLIVKNPPTDGSDQKIIFGFAFLLAIFAFATHALLRRARKNLAIIAVGPEGLCFPANDVGPVAWHDVTRVRLVTVTIRGGARFTYIRFSFRPGAVKQWQFGSLRKNQWEIMIASGSWLTGDTCRILGGTERLLESVAQYHPIENL